MGISCRFVNDGVALISMRCDLDNKFGPLFLWAVSQQKLECLSICHFGIAMNTLARYGRHFTLVNSHCWLLSNFAVFFFFLDHNLSELFSEFFSGAISRHWIFCVSTIILFIYCFRMVQRCSLLSQSLTAESIGLAEGLSGWMMITTTHPIEVDRSFLSFYSYEKTNNGNFDAQNAAGNWRMVNIESNWLNYCASICIYVYFKRVSIIFSLLFFSPPFILLFNASACPFRIYYTVLWKLEIVCVVKSVAGSVLSYLNVRYFMWFICPLQLISRLTDWVYNFLWMVAHWRIR